MSRKMKYDNIKKPKKKLKKQQVLVINKVQERSIIDDIKEVSSNIKKKTLEIVKLVKNLQDEIKDILQLKDGSLDKLEKKVHLYKELLRLLGDIIANKIKDTFYTISDKNLQALHIIRILRQLLKKKEERRK